MGRKETVWGAYDISLEEELEQLRKNMSEVGIRNPTKLEASFIIAEKSKQFKLKDVDVKKLIQRKRGVL